MVLHGISQAELARRVGISQQTVAHLVSGSAFGSKHLHQIARELGTTPAYLTEETDDPHAVLPDETLSSEERNWLDLLRAARVEDRKALLRLASTSARVASSTLHEPRQNYTPGDAEAPVNLWDRKADQRKPSSPKSAGAGRAKADG